MSLGWGRRQQIPQDRPFNSMKGAICAYLPIVVTLIPLRPVALPALPIHHGSLEFTMALMVTIS